jgi:excisionase family DNA binding protein
MALLDTESRRLLTESEAAEYLNLPPRTLSTWRQRGGGPRFTRLSRNVRYRQHDLDEFVNAGLRDNTSQTVAP